MQKPTTYIRGSDYHPIINFERSCRNCSLGKGEAVGGAGPDDLTKVKLIVLSDHTGYYEVQVNYPFWDNDGERQPKRDRRTGYYSVLNWRNAGSMLRHSLQTKFGLDTYLDCWMSNAVKCDPKDSKAQESHLKRCVSSWLKDEFALLDQYVPEVPILVAGNLAFKALKQLSPELGVRLNGSLQKYRRTNHHRYGLHPLVFTVNPAAIGKSVWRLESNVSINVHEKYVVRSVEEQPPMVGSPVWHFNQDLDLLSQVLSLN